MRSFKTVYHYDQDMEEINRRIKWLGKNENDGSILTF